MAAKKAKSQTPTKKAKLAVSKEKIPQTSKRQSKVLQKNSVLGKKQSKNETPDLLTLEEIEVIRKDIMESPKNYNKIVKLLGNFKSIVGIFSDNKETEINNKQLKLARGLLHNLYLVFSYFISQRLFKIFKGISEQDETVRKWILSKYEGFQKEIFSLWSIPYFTQSLATMKIDALEILMKLVKDEGKYLGPSIDDQFFPTLRFRKILLNLLSVGQLDTIDPDDGTVDDYLFLEFKESYFTKYWDLKFYLFNEFVPMLSDIKDSEHDHKLIFAKMITLIKSEPIYDTENVDKITEMETWVSNPPENTVYSLNTLKNNFENSWIGILNWSDLGKEEYSVALSIVHKRIIPYFSDAQKLMDFLTASYTLGIQSKDILLAILALNGLWELMKSYNLEYPNFYTNLYAVLTPELLHLKEKSRFFRLLDLFMSSTHLSASIVASFIKRLARLCLTAPPSGIVCVIPFIYNLIRKHGHSTCMLLIHSTTTAEEDAEYEDPFDEYEKDPSKTEALGSSIWELESMSNHYHPNVSALVKIFNQHFTKYSYNMEDFLDWSYSKLLDTELNKKFKGELGLEYEKWGSMFGDEGYMTDYLY